MAEVKKKRLERSKRRQIILDAARQAFLASGYSGARTRDIAERAGVTEALLYRHFASKEELFEEAIVAPLDQWTSSLPDYVLLTSGSDEAERREIARTANADLLRTTIEIMPLLGVVLFGSPEGGREFYLRKFLPLVERSVGATAAYNAGWTRPGLDSGVVTRAGIGLYLMYAMDAQFSGREVDVEEVARQFVDILFDGMVTREPPKPVRRAAAARRKA
jgi:AcrR family transcriptional regulator